MGLKLFGAGGIDQKSNNLLRADIDLIDSRNVMINTNNEYVKRPGTTEDTSFTDDDYSDMVFIKSMNQYFHRFGSDYVTYENGVRKEPYMWADPLVSGESKISLAEYLDTAIFTHEENQNFTAKYDGQSVYRAGLPVPNITLGTSGTKFLLYFFQFIDSKGNTIYGPANIDAQKDPSGSFTVATLKNSGFYSGYLRMNLALGLTTISKTSRTITYDSVSSDILNIGSKVTFKPFAGFSGIAGVQIIDTTTGNNVNGNFFIQLEVQSFDVGTKQITFTQESFGKYEVLLSPSVAGIYNVHGALSIKYFKSDSETTGYTGSVSDFYYPFLDGSLTDHSISYSFTSLSQLMSDIYDITTSKLRPPKCKYLHTYGYQLVCGNVISFYDFENKETKYTNNDLVMYSDLSTGDLGENFSESNRQLIGNTYDGQITGMGRVKDSLIVFKDKMVFAMDGVLIPGQYTLRKIETNEIGCTSFKSILSVENALMFQGQDGIYITDGYKAEKASTNLDPFFTTINNELTRSVMNNALDQYLFWTDKGVVVFDYHHRKWFIWDSIDASSGITVDNDLSIRFFSNSMAIKFQAALNDSGVEIDAYLRSSWLAAGEPGLLKKATFLRIYSFKNAGQKIYLKYFMDWSESKVKGPFEIDMSNTDIKTIKRNLDIIQNQSFSFEFRNNVINEDLNISGYEVNAGVIQERDKNVK